MQEIYFTFFVSLDKSVFGTKSFIISDDRLFTSSTDTSRKTIVTLRNNQPTSGRNELFINITECDDIDVCFATEEEYQQLCGGSCTTGCQFYTHTEQECTTYSIYIPDGNNGNSNTGNGNTGGTTTGGGSGTSSGSPTPPPCDGPTTGSRTESNLPCTPGWTPVPVTNNLGYYYSRLNQLYDSLMSNPYFFINPCDYLNQFKAIGNFQVPNSIKNKLDTLNFLYYNLTMAPNFVNSPFYVRDINSAYGTVVNCDYFPVHINTLPTINGVQWTSQQLFDYFRRNKNSFLDTSIARFTPYIDFPYIVDTGWNNANPLGSLLHLNMINDGTVIVSDYYSTTDSSRYIVSTVNSPLDGIHPVSGNRVWGINIDAVNGGYNFYTSAVDRITNPFFDIFNDIGELTPIPSGFEQADNLWRSMQSNMINFINNNDGNATLYSGSNEIKVRPPWFILKEFFKGNVTLEQLKAVFGC